MTIQKIRVMTLEGHFHKELSELYVTMLGDQDIILGTDWLWMHNPEVDWARPQIAFTQCSSMCTLSEVPLIIQLDKLQTCTTTINAMIPGKDTPDQATNEFTQDAMEAFLYNHSFSKYDDLAIRAKTTTSTTIVARNAPEPSTAHIPVQYQKYSKVFSEEASHHLPKHQAWDHAIELKSGVSMKNCSIY